MTEFVWDYCEASDILAIHRRDKKSSGCAELGDFIIDFDKDGKIIGLEIMHASDFLASAGISEEQLSQIQSAEMLVNHKNPEMIYVSLKLVFQDAERIIPVPAPVVAAA